MEDSLNLALCLHFPIISDLLFSKLIPGKKSILDFSAVQSPHLLDSGEYALALAIISQIIECVLPALERD